MNKNFVRGMRDGIPIALGYLSVSFGFGILAVGLGLSVAEAVGISVTNLTSTGQAAGVGIIAAGGSLLEMALTQLVINIRYSLMGLSLSQKLDESFSTPHRVLAAFGITDEIFAVAYAREEKIKPAYLYGLITVSMAGWTLGTYLGAAAGQILPERLNSAMGIVLYGMFLAICLPPAKKSKGVLLAVLVAALCSTVFHYAVPGISGGFSVVISAVTAAVLCSLLFPLPEVEP